MGSRKSVLIKSMVFALLAGTQTQLLQSSDFQGRSTAISPSELGFQGIRGSRKDFEAFVVYHAHPFSVHVPSDLEQSRVKAEAAGDVVPRSDSEDESAQGEQEFEKMKSSLCGLESPSKALTAGFSLVSVSGREAETPGPVREVKIKRGLEELAGLSNQIAKDPCLYKAYQGLLVAARKQPRTETAVVRRSRSSSMKGRVRLRSLGESPRIPRMLSAPQSDSDAVPSGLEEVTARA